MHPHIRRFAFFMAARTRPNEGSRGLAGTGHLAKPCSFPLPNGKDQQHEGDPGQISQQQEDDLQADGRPQDHVQPTRRPLPCQHAPAHASR